MRLTLAIVLTTTLCSACDSGPEPLPAPHGPASAGPGFPTTGDDPLRLDNAVWDDDPERVQALLEGGADPNARWSSHGDYFPLQEALEGSAFGHSVRNRAAIVRSLLQHGADPNARWCPFESRGGSDTSCRSDAGMTPLATAAILDLADVTYLLLDAKADPRAAAFGATALEWARSPAVFVMLQAAMFPDASSRNAATLAYLRERPDVASNTGPWDETPLTRAVAGRTGASVVPPEPPPRRGFDPSSRRSMAAERASLILDLGADPNERLTWDGGDWTPLAIAIHRFDFGAVRTLLEHGAAPNARWCVTVDEAPARRTRAVGCTLASGMTPLMAASSLTHPQLEALLIQHGADPALRDWQGRTAADYRSAARTPNPEPRTSNNEP
jgi:ankyrin repeat protein